MRRDETSMRLTRRVFALSLAASAAIPAAARLATGESARVQALLAQWVDVRRQCLGASLCVVDANGATSLAHGVRGLRDSRAVDPRTVFGIASLTKVFTGLLLADAILRGEIALDDPVRAHLPTGVSIPSLGGREIAIID